MSNILKRISLILAVCALTSACMTSCGSKKENPDISVDSSKETTEAETEELFHGMPLLENRNFDGKELTFILRDTPDDWSADDIICTEQNGETINDAVYTRNLHIEEKYNVKLKGKKAPLNHSIFKPVEQSILANTREFDIIVSRGYDAVDFLMRGYILELTELPYIALDKPWWAPQLSAELSIKNNLYFVTGDISRVDNMGVGCFFFNKDLLNNLSLENPYELVKCGKFTHDKMFEMAESALNDINGNGKFDSEDRYGITAQNILGMMLLYAGNVKVCGKNEQDLPVITVDSQYALNVFDSVKNHIAGNESVYYSSDWLNTQKRFAQNQTLFQYEAMLLIEALRVSDVNIGILPTPKFSEEQEDYISFIDGWCLNLVSIPINCENEDFPAFVLEAMARESLTTLTPAFYDVCLKGKYIRDNESSEMLDIIFSHYLADNAQIIGWGGLYLDIQGAFFNDKDLSSVIEKKRSKTEKDIQKTLVSIEEHYK